MNMSDEFELEKIRVAVIGLGYVGLPLAVELGKQVPVTGFDVSEVRILELIVGLIVHWKLINRILPKHQIYHLLLILMTYQIVIFIS